MKPPWGVEEYHWILIFTFQCILFFNFSFIWACSKWQNNSLTHLGMTMKILSSIGWSIVIWRYYLFWVRYAKEIEPITNSLYLFFYRPRSLAVTFLWILIGSHQWLRTIIGINKIVQFHTLRHLCTLKEKRILALLLSSCKQYICTYIFFMIIYILKLLLGHIFLLKTTYFCTHF